MFADIFGQIIGDILRSQPKMSFHREKITTPDGGTLNIGV